MIVLVKTFKIEGWWFKLVSFLSLIGPAYPVCELIDPIIHLGLISSPITAQGEKRI